MSIINFLKKLKEKTSKTHKRAVSYSQTQPQYTKQKKRHHRNKYFKKLTEEEDRETDCSWCDIDTDNRTQMIGIAKWWWNCADNYESWVDTLRDYNNADNSETFKKNFYYNMVEAKQISLKLKRDTFNKMFDICFGIIKGWVDDITIDIRSRIKGALENEILNLFVTNDRLGKSKNIKYIYENINNFESVINGVLTRLEKKNIIEFKEVAGKSFIVLNNKLKVDEIGFYLEEI